MIADHGLCDQNLRKEINIIEIYIAKVNADKTMIKESYRVNSGLNCIYFHNSYHTLKIKSRPVRVIVVRFRFCNEIRYDYHKLNNLQNIQISNKSTVNKSKDSILLWEWMLLESWHYA